MSRGNAGRGRGWLNFTKTSNAPGGLPSPPINHTPASPTINNEQFSDAYIEHDIITKVKELNLSDDGIKFNQKLKYILEKWKENCQNGEEVGQSFESLHNASLHDSELASKLVYMISSRQFISQEVHDQNIRLLFLRKLQDNFETSKQLQKSNPQLFRNSVQMLGEFYNKARLLNGQQLTFMATPFLNYLEMLLETATVDDLKLFTSQLYLNGSSIKAESPDKLTEVLNQARVTMAGEKPLAKEGRLWLLLALEVSNNRFAILPSEIHQFYQAQLGDSEMASFQVSHANLSIQTNHTSKTLDSFQSSVNVLQVSTASEVSNEPVSPSSSVEYTQAQNYSSGIGSDSSQSNNSFNRRETPRENSKNSSSNSSKPGGRPILGAGARLKPRNEDNSNWRDHGRENSSSGGEFQQKNNTWRENKAPPKQTKGWEHDDRFETDYS